MKGRTDHALHEVLRQIPYGLHVLGVCGENGVMTATVVSWAMQCSFFPPLIGVALRNPSRTYDLVKEGRAFSLNLIRKEDHQLVKNLVKPAARFGDKIGRVEHSEEETGAPILQKAFAYMECLVHSIEEPGDHALVIGKVVHAGLHGAGEPLVTADLGWHYGG